ncbi:MAG TPA: hypothetical protein DDZ96_04585 [Porphyromonadaceae bacterium]|nr:hypothetical protein [Porphyromonadaceae bacterium]HBL33081.1 hypothetical protein [Porphyromonadaceae bacterium]HBX20286.1 hypothetical protein [Porphyromonadaceae bacterium]HCM19599.1 hypothetical protein [Porphyromonadaceae bacterium]
MEPYNPIGIFIRLISRIVAQSIWLRNVIGLSTIIFIDIPSIGRNFHTRHISLNNDDFLLRNRLFFLFGNDSFLRRVGIYIIPFLGET